MTMTPETRKPAGQGQAFREVHGEGSPQQIHDAFLHKYQHNYGPVHLLADLLDRHLALRAEIVRLRVENARLQMIVGGGV